MSYVGRIIRHAWQPHPALTKYEALAFRSIDDWHKSNPEKENGVSYAYRSMMFDINDTKMNLLVVAEKKY